MCTCIQLQTKDSYFGRNLDLEYRFGEQVVITPRGYEFSLKNGTVLKTQYAMIGMATVMRNFPLYAEASNEKGLSMAGLYFPGNACFFQEEPSCLNIATYELIPYFLGNYGSIEELRNDLKCLNISNIPFAPDVPISQLHWMLCDEKECIVMEQTEVGLKIYDNPIGVLTNNPPFDFHLQNIRNYLTLSPRYVESSFSEHLKLEPYGQGMGAIGLPGDSSPASRFVRAAFHKMNSVCEVDENASVTQFFHILDSVAMVQGSTITKEGKYDITTYSCCINMNQGIYYYKTYRNHQITAICMTEETKLKQELSIYPLRDRQQIYYEN